MIGAILALVLAGGFGAFFYWLIKEDRSGWSRVLGLPDFSLEKTYMTGVTSVAVRAGWPSARLDFFAWGLRVSAATLWKRWLIPVWEVRFSELASAELVSSRYGDLGVRIALADGSDAPIFWTFSTAEILDHLESRGLPVNRSLTPLRWDIASYAQHLPGPGSDVPGAILRRRQSRQPVTFGQIVVRPWILVLVVVVSSWFFTSNRIITASVAAVALVIALIRTLRLSRLRYVHRRATRAGSAGWGVREVPGSSADPAHGDDSEA